MEDPVKSLEYIKCYSSNSPDLLKALTVLSDTLVRRPAVDSEDLKPYWKSEKRLPFSRWSKILFFPNFSKNLLTTKTTLKRL